MTLPLPDNARGQVLVMPQELGFGQVLGFDIVGCGPPQPILSKGPRPFFGRCKQRYGSESLLIRRAGPEPGTADQKSRSGTRGCSSSVLTVNAFGLRACA